MIQISLVDYNLLQFFFILSYDSLLNRNVYLFPMTYAVCQESEWTNLRDSQSKNYQVL